MLVTKGRRSSRNIKAMKNFKNELQKLSWQELYLLVVDIFFPVAPREKDDSQFIQQFKSDFKKEDIQRNAVSIFGELFLENNQKKISRKIEDIIYVLNNSVDSLEDPLFDEIETLQQVISMAIWKYKMPLRDDLEQFAREYDRIDDERERLRLILKPRSK